MVVVGIDPGYTGALVLLTDFGCVEARPMPIFEEKNRGKTRREVDGDTMADILTDWLIAGPLRVHDSHVFIEKVQAMPTIKNGKRTPQGSSSSFKFGEAAGIVRGVVSGLHLPRTRIAPASWKAKVGLIGRDKDAARQKATELYPAYRELWRTKNRVGIADALLIAHVGLLSLEGHR